MKKVFISLIIASLFVACSDNKEEEKTKNEQVKEEVKAPLNQRITITENKTVIEKDNPLSLMIMMEIGLLKSHLVEKRLL